MTAGSHATEGNVLARISVRTLIVKEWKETFWIITGGKLLLYRAKEDYLYVSTSTTQEHGLVWIMGSCVCLVSLCVLCRTLWACR